MFHALRTRPAESMIETLISIVVIVLASTATLSMLRTSIMGNNVIGEKLVAIELALEGLDAVKSIRDTNYLLFPDDTETCWNRLGLTLSSTCSSATRISDGGEYYLKQNFTSVPLYRWNMRSVSTSGPSAATDGDLYLFDYNTTISTDAVNSSVPFYSDSHNASADFVTLESGQFNRRVTIEYDPLDSTGADLCSTNQCFRAIVTVEWTIANLTQSVSLSRIISNVY